MRIITKFFSIYLLLIGISAIFGGWAIIYTHMMKFPPDLLATTPFDSYVIPGTILTLVVGGTQLIATYLLWTTHKYMYEAAAVSGFCLLIWITTEWYMIPSHHPIQIMYFGLAIATLVTVMYLLKYHPVHK